MRHQIVGINSLILDEKIMILDEMDAFEAMRYFLKAFYLRTHSDDVGALLGDLNPAGDGKPIDPAAWSDWMDAVDKALNKK